MPTIDAHLHVWNLKRLNYHWLGIDQPTLFRDVLPEEVYPLMRASGIEAAMLVEAANLSAEIPYLVEMAEQYDWIAGVVGWMSEDDPLSGEAPPMLRGARIPAVAAGATPTLPQPVERYGLTCDLIVNYDAYEQAHRLIAAHPGTTFVIDHFAGAALTPGGHAEWAQRIRPLAALPNTVVKVSGYLTAAQPKPLAAETLRAYVESAVERFGAARLLFGSDYPICTQAGSYGQAVEMLREAMRHLDATEQAQIMGNTAARVYRL